MIETCLVLNIVPRVDGEAEDEVEVVDGAGDEGDDEDEDDEAPKELPAFALRQRHVVKPVSRSPKVEAYREKYE